MEPTRPRQTLASSPARRRTRQAGKLGLHRVALELILPVPAEEDDLEGARGVKVPLDLRAEARAAPQYEIALVLRPSVVVLGLVAVITGIRVKRFRSPRTAWW